MATTISDTDTLAALRFPNYRLWFFGQMVSLVGTWMQATAQGYLIYSLTGSTAYLGLITFIGGIPTWLFTMLGGVIADRIPRRKLLVITQIGMMLLALVMSGLVFLKIIQPWHIAILAFLLGVVNAFDAPTRLSFVRELVNKETMTNAIALNASMFNVATIVGPAVGGLVYAAVGPGWCFFFNGISFIAVILSLLLMKTNKIDLPLIRQNALLDLKEGIKYVIQHTAIRSLIVNLGFVSLFGFGLVALMPAWAVQVLGGDVLTNGWLLSARGAGALIGTLLLAYVAGRKIRGKLWSYALILVPILWIGFSLVNNLTPSLIVLAAVGLVLIVEVNLTNAMVQTEVEDSLRGRVMGIYTTVFFGLQPVGALIAGIVATQIGEQLTVTASGVILLILAIFTWIRMPYLRKIE